MTEELKRRMTGAIDALKKDFAGLRTGRANVTLMDHVIVDAHGSKMPLKHVSTISIMDPRTISVSVWDRDLVKAVEKGISDASLGVSVVVDGTVMRVIVPEMSEERRREVVKIAAKNAEHARVAIRNVRRDGMDHLKRQEKEKEISEDEHKRMSDAVQKLTDDFIKAVDELLATKEKEIMRV